MQDDHPKSTFLEPIIQKRNYFENNLDEVHDILNDGESRGREAAQETMKSVREAMGFG